MQLAKKEIDTSVGKSVKDTQITIDDDFNVPDTREDIDKIILTKGAVFLETVEPMVDRIRVAGKVKFRVLYSVEKENMFLDSLEGEIPFDETLTVEGLLPTFNADAGVRLEDINVSMINSRKVVVRGVVGLQITVMDKDKVEGATGLENGDGVQCLYKKMPYTVTVGNKKDMYRIREEVELPQNKPNIHKLIWSSVVSSNVEVKPMDRKLSVRGELSLFVIYKGEEEHMPIQYFTTGLPFSGEIECVESTADAIADIMASLGEVEINVKPDADGEERLLDVACNLEMDIKMYQDEEVTLLGDLYSPNVEITTESEEFEYESLITRNSAKTKVAERIRMKEDEPKLLQICHVDGTVKVDETKVMPEGIQVEGVVVADIIYITGEDNRPIHSMEAMLPFTYLVEAKNLKAEDSYRVTPVLEQMSAIMIDSEEVELKAAVNMSIIAFARRKERAITDLEIKPLDYNKIKDMPGMIGYIVKEDDTLWSIAKKYYCTIESIRQINALDKDELAAGKKLLLVKG